MIKVLLAFLLALVTQVSNELWDQFWELIFDSMDKAEAKWVESGSGKVKRDWVVNQAKDFISEKLKGAGKPLAWLDKWLVGLAIGAIVDGTIKTFNTKNR